MLLHFIYIKTNYKQDWTYLVKMIITNFTRLAIVRIKDLVHLNVAKRQCKCRYGILN